MGLVQAARCYILSWDSLYGLSQKLGGFGEAVVTISNGSNISEEAMRAGPKEKMG